MNEYLLILKMIASQEPRYEKYEFFPGNCSRTVCPVCQRIITLAKLAVAEAEKLEAKNREKKYDKRMSTSETLRCHKP